MDQTEAHSWEGWRSRKWTKSTGSGAHKPAGRLHGVQLADSDQLEQLQRLRSRCRVGSLGLGLGKQGTRARRFCPTLGFGGPPGSLLDWPRLARTCIAV